MLLQYVVHRRIPGSHSTRDRMPTGLYAPPLLFPIETCPRPTIDCRTVAGSVGRRCKSPQQVILNEALRREGSNSRADQDRDQWQSSIVVVHRKSQSAAPPSKWTLARTGASNAPHCWYREVEAHRRCSRQFPKAAPQRASSLILFPGRLRVGSFTSQSLVQDDRLVLLSVPGYGPKRWRVMRPGRCRSPRTVDQMWLSAASSGRGTRSSSMASTRSRAYRRFRRALLRMNR